MSLPSQRNCMGYLPPDLFNHVMSSQRTVGQNLSRI